MIDLILLEQLYIEHYSFIFSVCRKIVKRHEVAQDLTHDTFLQLIDSYDKYSGKSTFRTWLYRVAVNICLMHLRKKARSNEIIPLASDVRDWEDKQTTFTPLMEERIYLEEALTQLAPGYRGVFVRKELYGMQQGEIAEAMGIGVGTVKSQNFKAQGKLRELLK